MFLSHHRSHKIVAGKSYCAYYCFCKSTGSSANERGDVNTTTPQVTALDLKATQRRASTSGAAIEQRQRRSKCLNYSTLKGRLDVSNERANDLARYCTLLVRKGNDFPTIWSAFLKTHSLVEGIPRQRHDGSRSLLDIPLITGEQLVFDADIKEFRVQ